MTASTDLWYLRPLFALFENFISWVIIRWRQDYLVWHFAEFGCVLCTLIPSTELSVSSTAPGVKLVVLGRCQCVESSSWYLLDLLVLKSTNYSWQFIVCKVPVAALALIIRLSAATPCIDYSVLVKRNRMKVTTVYLHNFGSIFNQSRDKTRFVLRRTFRCLFLACFLVQSASPSVNMSFFCESHRMVITASHGFNPGGHGYLSELCQVNYSVWRYAEFAVEVWSTDKHFTAFRYDDWVMATRADAPCWLAILELTKDGSWKKCVSLAADTNFSIFVLAKGPNEWLLIYYLLRDNLNIIHFFIFFNISSCRRISFILLRLHWLAVWISCMIRWAAKAPAHILTLSDCTTTTKHGISSCSILSV